ncbi:ABC transporter ATP-binding protein [Bordetella muralis]|uniref:ABC transporter ATP-binding protein n=1 Tax=Bordetella muralis TaxID=1649130 RepID=UPI0039EFA6DA
MSKHSLDIESVSHRYGSFLAVDEVDLSVDPGEVVALLGPSGCGKTTLLRIVAGFVKQTQGRIRVDGRSIDDLQPNRRDIGIVFQNYALFPHMTVAQNVAYGLDARGRSRVDTARRVQECLEAVQLPHLAQRYPRQLSGGQQQRVALARAIATEPHILLLDEPFSALDKNLRLDMQIEIKRLQRQLGLTAILVTHDQEEAMSVADRIAIMNRGRVEQLGTPVDIYDRPETLFVNSFIGSTNLLEGRVSSTEGAGLCIALDAGASIVVPYAKELSAGQRVMVSLRPEHLDLFDKDGAGRWPVDVTLSLPLGPSVVHQVLTRDQVSMKISAARRGLAHTPQGRAWCGVRPDALPSLFLSSSNAN